MTFHLVSSLQLSRNLHRSHSCTFEKLFAFALSAEPFAAINQHSLEFSIGEHTTKLRRLERPSQLLYLCRKSFHAGSLHA